MKIMSILLIALGLYSCASQPVCLSEQEEPVSYCRAKVACGQGWKSSLGMILGGFNPNGGRNVAIDQYNNCIDASISSQRSNVGLKSQDYKCVSNETSPGHFESNCSQK